MEPAPAGDLLGRLAHRLAVVAGGEVTPLRRAGRGARQWRSAQPARTGCDPEQLRYAASAHPELAQLVDDLRADGTTLVATLAPSVIISALEGLRHIESPSSTLRFTDLPPGEAPRRLALDDPVFTIQLAFARALRDSRGQRWKEADGIPAGALDDPGPTADLVTALLEAPRRLLADGASREAARAGLGAVATAYLAWDDALPARLRVPDSSAAPVLPARLLASASARVLERGMCGVGIAARERI